MPSIINLQAIKLARAALYKQAIVPAGDPTMTGGAPPGGDPSMGGAPPPGMDPSMGGMPPGGGGPPPGMDPSMGGGAPPPGGGGDIVALIQQTVQQAVQTAMAGQGGGGGGGAGMDPATGQIKPKIDVNVEIMQIKHMLAKLIDALGVPVSAQEMVATPDKLTAMGQGQDPSMGGGAAAGGMPPGGAPPGGGAIPPTPPMEPMKAAMFSLDSSADLAAALRDVLRVRRSA